jgi:hypothetical protein
MATRFDLQVSDAEGKQIRQAAANLGQSHNEYIKRRVVVGSEPPPYRFSAGNIRDHSFVRDLAQVQGWSTGERPEIDEAIERLRRFSQWSEDNPLMFAPQTTTTASAIIPPRSQNAINITMTADRPLVSATDQLPLLGSSPFSVPRWTSGGTVDPARAEGAQPTEVDTVFGTATVSPRGLSGQLNLTRELVDSASPGGDIIALQVMREDFYRQCEIITYNELNGANGAGGTITAGFVPSGAQAVNDAAPTTGLLVTLKKQLLQYANVRRRKARSVIAGGPALTNLGGLFGAEANTGDDTCLANIFGARLNAAVNTFGVAAGDSRILLLGSNDVCTFESPLADFRFDEQSGPALVRCAVWGYFAVTVARPVGVSGIRF